jgi:hypothetical protein
MASVSRIAAINPRYRSYSPTVRPGKSPRTSPNCRSYCADNAPPRLTLAVDIQCDCRNVSHEPQADATPAMKRALRLGGKSFAALDTGLYDIVPCCHAGGVRCQI